jgi:hypothetical protein
MTKNARSTILGLLHNLIVEIKNFRTRVTPSQVFECCMFKIQAKTAYTNDLSMHFFLFFPLINLFNDFVIFVQLLYTRLLYIRSVFPPNTVDR